MRIFRRYSDIPEECRHAVVGVGNFDGVHKGHQALIARAKGLAKNTSALLGVLVEVPIADALKQIGRPLGPLDPLFAITALVIATVLVIAAGALRPFVPDLEAVASRLQRFVWAADPVPAGVSAFRVLERAVTLSSTGFGLFEQRAGVWLATILIVALLVWSTR